MSRKLFFGKLILIFGLLSLMLFLYGFLEEVGVGQRVLFWLLSGSLFFKLLKVGFEWYHYAGLPEPPQKSVKPKAPEHPFTVDMLTTFCPGEPFDMLERTLRAMVGVRYPHTTYLCDEGNDPVAKKLCEKLGVVHVTRETHENAKAGNINNALKQATGEICVILDPDHAPFPEFLDHVLHHFDNPEIGYVQVVQAYGNQSESLIAQGAAEQTYIFYGPYMQAMSGYGTAQAIGANCTFRRAALDSIGGHAPGLTEDMHTSMLLHAEGWKSVYEPVILSRGQVPSSISAYYKQQLKWSRGTFDLWLNLFPKLFFKFDWRQKLHYGLLPVYYLFGLIGIVDFVVPIYSLLTGEYPWLVDPGVFFVFFTPFFLFSLAYRYYAQGWLNHQEERGIHLMGGILRVGTWWIYTIGFVYTLLNIKVPYIPTEKEHSTKGEFLLGLPNLLVAIISLGAVVYGLSQDWQPYSMLMAAFALVNAFVLFFAFAIGQTTWVSQSKSSFYKFRDRYAIKEQHLSYLKLSRLSFRFALVLLLASTSLLIVGAIKIGSDQYLDPLPKTPIEKELGGFYLGMYNAQADVKSDLSPIRAIENESGMQWSIISTYVAWGDGQVPTGKLRDIVAHGAIPMLTWEPFSNLFEQYQDVADLKENKRIFRYILDGYFDSYIDEMAVALRDLHSPVFLRFAHEMENPMYPWSVSGGNSPEDFVEAWKYLHYRFEKVGAHNVSWVWSPWSTEGFESYFPYGNDGSYSQYVDWIGLTGLNYGLASPGQSSKSFDEIYSPFKERIKAQGLELPVMIAEFGSTSYGVDGKQWVDQAMASIQERHKEIRSAVFFYSDLDKNWVTAWRPAENAQFIDWTFDLGGVSKATEEFELFEGKNYLTESGEGGLSPKMLVARNGAHELLVDGEPFYIKGIAYNAGNDWEEGFKPLSRKQLDADFELIKQMGANTIRRYEPGIYDRNILRAADEHGLKVMFGFWFDPKVDYLQDQGKLDSYRKKVLAAVEKHKDNPSIIAWNIGNETWGLLKKHYAQPYLSVVRRSYLEFLDGLAVQIREIDPQRPVFSSEEHDNERLIGAISQYRAFAPHVDVIGINSYYEENISELQEIMEQAYPGKPYAVTEFGPKGYWNQELGDYWRDSLLIELSSVKKAGWYRDQWLEYIEKHKGDNLGGVAFSWTDRYEGTATWFGITDHKGRLKPSYYSLQSVWQEEPSQPRSFPDITISGHWHVLSPGETLWLSAAVTNGYEGDLEYSWEVYDENWQRSTPVLATKLEGKFVEIQMPAKPSRLYLYAKDSEGNTITASRPLLVSGQ
ncbi:glycosyltransferase [Algoriphagus sp. H41]|uniref:Glycosyltransferase n=1 Tax=Algoriphagus oliviformis TaxID=2811231 RepID=A0ABS3C6I6_9BACT|nr:glycosyltransferase [Algoriphagus oliviformis]MBN7812460.1 glycosyltransferase [Algoriphagus oliviformis]